MTNQQDRRHHQRINFELDVHAHSTEKGQTIMNQGKLIDISLCGALVEFDGSWNGIIDREFVLEIFLNNGNQTIKMTTQAKHINDQIIGFHCEQIDIDSATHLRRIIELNVGDPEILERELSALIANHVA